MSFVPTPVRRPAAPRLRHLKGPTLALLAMGLGALTQPAWSQPLQSACASREAQTALEPLEWDRRHDLQAASTSAALDGAVLKPGRTARAFLRRERAVAFVVQPGGLSRPGQFGGMFRVRIERPGTYRIMLDSKAWLDVLKDGVVVAPIGYGPGPACSRVRKSVDFLLGRGDHLLQLSTNPGATAVILIMPRPDARPGRHGAALAPRDLNPRGDLRR